jgi:hypothetical protein
MSESKHEEWRPVQDERFAMTYMVSSFGRVAAIRERIPGMSRILREKRILKPGADEHGYLRCVLGCGSEKGQTVYVHRLVLEAFVGPSPEGWHCCHGDGAPWNNRVENLRWGTPAENGADKIKHRSDSAMSIDDKVQARAMRANGVTVNDIAKHFNVGRTAISRVTKDLAK